MRWVTERMRALKISQRQLAARIKEEGGEATGSAISDILSGKRPSSRLVPYINEILGGMPPVQQTVQEATDELKARIDQNWDKLTPEERRTLSDLVVQMTHRR